MNPKNNCYFYDLNGNLLAARRNYITGLQVNTYGNVLVHLSGGNTLIADCTFEDAVNVLEGGMDYAPKVKA